MYSIEFKDDATSLTSISVRL